MDSIQLLNTLQLWLVEFDSFLRWFSLHAYSHNYLFIAAALYLSGFPAIGARLGCAVLTSTLVFGSCRQFFASPRPYWAYPELFRGIEEKAWGMPSGHSQNATVFWGMAARYSGWSLLWIVALIIIFCIALSRLYLGVHFPLQVVTGLLLGSLIVLAWIKLESALLAWLKSLSNKHQLMFILLLTSLPILITLLLREGLLLGPGNGSAIPYKYLSFYTGLINGAGVSLWLAFQRFSFTRASCKPLLILTRTLPGLTVAMVLWHFRFIYLNWFDHHGLLYCLLWLHGVLTACWVCLLCPLLQQKLASAKITTEQRINMQKKP